jgi:hypothetical protein
MRLSAEMYDRIVSGLKSDTQGEKNKRREPRVGLAGEVDFVAVTEIGKRLAGSAKIRDVSRSGIGLLFTQQIPRNQRFIVQLSSEQDNELWLICVAAYCRPTSGGFFSVGAKITQTMRGDQIRKTEARTADTAAKEPAESPPRKCHELDMSEVARIARAILD